MTGWESCDAIFRSSDCYLSEGNTKHRSSLINNSQSELRSNLILLLALRVLCLQIVKLGLEDIADQVAKLDLHLLPA